MLPVQASVGRVDDEGLATANFVTIRMFGALVGLAICSPTCNTVFSAAISSAAMDLTGPLEALKDASNAINTISELRSLNVSTETLETLDQVSQV